MNKKLLPLLGLVIMSLSACNNKPATDPAEDNDKYDYVFLAQPMVTAVLNEKTNFSIFANVQQDYKTKTNGLEITQASIFVKADADTTKVNQFLAMIKADVTSLLADPVNEIKNATTSLEEQIVSSKLGGKPALIGNLLNNGNSLGVNYKEAISNKDAIDAFIGTIGLPATTEDIYFTTTESEASSQLNLNVAVPAGAPAVPFYKNLTDSHLEVAGADTVVAYLTSSSSKDVVIAPTNAGINAIKQGANFKLAATVTFGNFFLVSTGNDNDGILNKGDKVLAFQEKGVPGKIFNYVYGDKELDVKFVTDAAAAKTEILTEK